MGSSSSPGDAKEGRGCLEEPGTALRYSQRERKQGLGTQLQRATVPLAAVGESVLLELRLQRGRGRPLDFRPCLWTSDLQSYEAICAAANGEFVVLL